jgi:hypothetical protein
MKVRLRAAERVLRIRPDPAMTCVRCGEVIHRAQCSENIDEWRVRHTWECDASGYSFSTLLLREVSRQAAA